MAYATVAEVEAGFRDLSQDEEAICTALLDEAAIIIDSYNADATAANKKLVSCRMVRRSIGDSDTQSVPIGATTGSMSAMGYSQSWTLTNGSAGQLYLEKLEKKLLGVGNKIGSYSPTQELVPTEAT